MRVYSNSGEEEERMDRWKAQGSIEKMAKFTASFRDSNKAHTTEHTTHCDASKRNKPCMERRNSSLHVYTHTHTHTLLQSTHTEGKA